MTARDYSDDVRDGIDPDPRCGAEPMHEDADHEPASAPQERSERPPCSALEDLWHPPDRAMLFEPAPPRDWLLKRAAENDGPDIGFMPRGNALMLTAGGGTGKTMALGQLALCIASGTGRPWIGSLVVADEARRGRVVLAVGEEDQKEMHRRLYAGAQALGLTPEQRDRAIANLKVLPLRGRDCKLTCASRDGEARRTDLHAEFMERLSNDGPTALVILDPLIRFAGANAETSQEAATAFVEAVEALTTVPGKPSVLVAHHTSQEALLHGNRTAVAARGVTSLPNGFRWVLNLVEEDASGGRVVSVNLSKTNCTQPIFERFYARRDFDLGGALVRMAEADLVELDEARRSAEPAQRRATARAERVRASASSERDAVLAVIPLAPAHVDTAQVDLALRRLGIAKGMPTLRGLLKGLLGEREIEDISDGRQCTERMWARRAPP